MRARNQICLMNWLFATTLRSWSIGGGVNIFPTRHCKQTQINCDKTRLYRCYWSPDRPSVVSVSILSTVAVRRSIRPSDCVAEETSHWSCAPPPAYFGLRHLGNVD